MNLKLLLSITLMVILVSCHKEKLPSELEPLEAPEWHPVSYNTEMTESGNLIVLHQYQPGQTADLRRFNLSGGSIGSDIKSTQTSSPAPGPFSYFVYHNNYIWLRVDDTIYVIPENFQALELPERRIVISGQVQGNFFTVTDNTIFGIGKDDNTLDKLFKADLSNLWDPQYDTAVFFTNGTYASIPYETGMPKQVHNGYLLCSGGYGVSVVDTSDLTLSNYIGFGATKDFIIHNNLLYGLFSDQDGTHSAIFDVTDPSNPRGIAGTRYNGETMAFSKDKMKWLIQDDYKVRVLDVSDPENVKLDNIYDINGLFYNNMIGSMEIYNDLLVLVSGVTASKGLIVCRLPDF